ncbi:MAG: hypothetical protein GXY82_02950 [Methanospirillum sp.]|nr:hypothetical protein [Methanospirillum sp.]
MQIPKLLAVRFLSACLLVAVLAGLLSTPAVTGAGIAPVPATACRGETSSPPVLASAPGVVTGQAVVPGPYTVPPGTGIFTVTSVGHVPVGSDGVVQLVVDNGWSPLFGDTYVDISWDPSIVAYQSATIKVLNTTAAVSSDRSVRIMLGDFRRGYPQGRYPLAAITLRALREGTSVLTVSVDHVRYWSNDLTEFTDITGTASGQSGLFSTGPLPIETQPLVTFTQNTLAPESYPVDVEQDVETTTVAITTTVARTTPTPTTAPPTSTVVPTATSVSPVTTGNPATPANTSTFAPVSTRITSSPLPGSLLSLAALCVGGLAFHWRRRDP